MYRKLLKYIRANIKDVGIKNRERYLNRADKENIFPIDRNNNYIPIEYL